MTDLIQALSKNLSADRASTQPVAGQVSIRNVLGTARFRVVALTKAVAGFVYTFVLMPLAAAPSLPAVGKALMGTGPRPVRTITSVIGGEGLLEGPAAKRHGTLIDDSTLVAPPSGGPTGETAPADVVSFHQGLTARQIGEALVGRARAFLGTPYRSGGRQPGGFDCSGFTRYIYGQLGFNLPASSKTQAEVGQVVSTTEARPGDLVFFARGLEGGPSTARSSASKARAKSRAKARAYRPQIYHTGIVVSKPGQPLQVIHSASSQGVTITTLAKSAYWSRHLYQIRRPTAG